MAKGPFHILYLKEHIRRGDGDAQSLVYQIEELAKRGHTQSVLVSMTDMAGELNKAGVKMYYGPLDTRSRSLRTAFRAIRRIEAVAHQEEADLIHAHHRWPGFLGWIASRSAGVPMVSTDHNTLRGMRLLSYRGEAVISVSDAGREHLVSYFGVPDERITVVSPFHAAPGDADPAAVERLRAELGIAPGTPCVGRLASQNEAKAPDVMLEAFAGLRRRRSEAHLVMAGGGPLLAAMKEETVRRGLESHVRWLGARKDISTVLGLLDVFVMSSRFEGAPLAIMEAMEFGVPVVGTAVGGVPRLLDDGRCGLLVPPDDPEALAEAVERMLSDAQLRERCVEMARKHVREHYGPPVLADKIEDLYERVCREHPAPWR